MNELTPPLAKPGSLFPCSFGILSSFLSLETFENRDGKVTVPTRSGKQGSAQIDQKWVWAEGSGSRYWDQVVRAGAGAGGLGPGLPPLGRGKLNG